jgi:hypothetical protein
MRNFATYANPTLPRLGHTGAASRAAAAWPCINDRNSGIAVFANIGAVVLSRLSVVDGLLTALNCVSADG